MLPRPRSAIALEARAGSASVAGRVVRVADRGAAPAAMVEVRPVGRDGSRSAQPTDSTGGFAFRDLPPGRYALGVASLGYFRAVDTVRVTPDSGVTALVALARDFVVLDGCGYAQVRVRRPRWKVW